MSERIALMLLWPVLLVWCAMCLIALVLLSPLLLLCDSEGIEF